MSQVDREMLLRLALHPGVLMHATGRDVIKTNEPGMSADGSEMRSRLVAGMLEDRRLAFVLRWGLRAYRIRHPFDGEPRP